LDFTIEESGFNPTLQNGVGTAADLDVKCSNRVFNKDRGITVCRKERSYCQYQELRDNQDTVSSSNQVKGSRSGSNQNQVLTTNQDQGHQNQVPEESKQIKNSFKDHRQHNSKDQESHQCVHLQQPEQQRSLGEQPRLKASNQTSINRHPLLMIN